jgi:hypothetical protein
LVTCVRRCIGDAVIGEAAGSTDGVGDHVPAQRRHAVDRDREPVAGKTPRDGTA